MTLSSLYDHILHSIPHFTIYLELILLAMVLWIMFKKSSSDGSRLTKAEEEVIKNFIPEPMVEEIDINHKLLHRPTVSVQEGKYITVDGKKCLNMATQNFLGFAKDQLIEEESIETIKKYGVGSCGPRGFFGTVDVHLELEEELSKFLSTEEAVVYSYGFSTTASAIPAYSKKNDIIFADECVNYAIQKGFDASRSVVYYFKHNDVNDLERILIEMNKKGYNKKSRRFLVIEGLYQKTGNICPLKEMIEIRKKYKLRMMLDESISIGTIGQTGRGLREYFNVEGSEIDLIIGSLENSLGSVGGFCVGTSFIVEHQRLSGLGYCFSASLPPVLTTAATGALKMLARNPELVKNLQEMSKFCSDALKQSDIICNKLKISGVELSPVKFLALKKPEDGLLDRIVNNCLDNGVALAIPSYLEDDKFKPPVIKLVVNTLHTKSDIQFAIETIEAQIKALVF